MPVESPCQPRRARTALAAAVVVLAVAVPAPPALAAFPFVGDGTANDPASWRLAPGHTVSNLGQSLVQHFGAVPQSPAGLDAALIARTNSQPDELCGVMGMSITDGHAVMPSGTGSCIAAGTPLHTAFQVTLGRPDVTIAELDSGIKWDSSDAMLQLRKKVLLNPGELPAPRVDLAKPFDATTAANCAAARPTRAADYDPRGNAGQVPYDVLGQGVFDTLDYACDSRLAKVVGYPRCANPPTTTACRNGPPGMLTPEDLIIAFSDGIDHDRNGRANDIAGWNFVDDNNDPYDDVHYGHGTGEQEDSSAEANSGVGDTGTCPNCEVLPLRVGESFVADANRFAQAVIYATDRGIDVVQEPLGTYNAPLFARQAIDYAYNHGVTVMASAADEAAEHHNQPGALPHTIVVNALRGPDTLVSAGPASLGTTVPPSWLQLDGCTNFGTRIDLAVTGNSCSSEATGKSSGVVGLIYSAALNACGAPLHGRCADGRLAPARGCTRVDGAPCVVTPNEVLQLLASGNIAGTAVNGSSPLAGDAPSNGAQPADTGSGGQADDVNTALQPERSCGTALQLGCTDPNLNTTFALDQNAGIVGTVPDTFRYPARKGWDEFFGYGRLDAYKAVAAAAQGWIPPQADITSPEWFAQLDPARSKLDVSGSVDARAPYTCRVEVAPGAAPNNAARAAGGDFAPVPSSYCDGAAVHDAPYSGSLAQIDTAMLERLFPRGDPTSFTGNENGGPRLAQTASGRPNTLPYAFTVRVVVSTAPAASGPAMTGEDRRQLFLHRDQEMLPGFPVELRTDGDASPLLVDLAGDNSNQLVVATSDGWIHAYRYDPATGALADLPGWPVHTKPLAVHPDQAAYRTGGLPRAHFAPVLEAPAAGDLFHDGRQEIVVDDLEGNVYAWDAAGHLVFRQRANPAYSGAPLAGQPSWAAQRSGVRQRTEGGFLTSPVLANLDPGDRRLDIIAAGEDRHVYAWHPDGKPVAGFPVLVEDPNKVAAVDPTSNQLAFNRNVAVTTTDIKEDQGKLVDTPAVAQLDGPGKPPTILVGSNEEYAVGVGNEGPLNAGGLSTASLGLIGRTGVLHYANGRVYAIKAAGCSSEPSSCVTGGFACRAGGCHSVAFRAGWPAKIGIIDQGLLPDVGEGINGAPVVAPLACPSGGAGIKIGVSPAAGPAYVLNADGSSCYGTTGGTANALATDLAVSLGKLDTPVFAAVGEPSFGTLDGRTTQIFTPVAGLLRALDVALSDYQAGGQDFIGGWDAGSGQFHLGWPAVDNDLSFITGQTVGDITGHAPQQQVLAGTASLDLQAYGADGRPASQAWPKLTGDWLVATPILGSLGTVDSVAHAPKDVVSLTRTGTLAAYRTPAPACSPSSWPNFHHDVANSGDLQRDALPPAAPLAAEFDGAQLLFRAPGGDGMCGRARAYQLVTSRNPIDATNFAAASTVPQELTPAAAGDPQSLELGSRTLRYVAVRAVDATGNLGLPAVIDRTAASVQDVRGADCLTFVPVSSFAAAHVSHRRARLVGHAVDRSCGRAAIVRERVSVALRVGRLCRFVRRSGRLTRPRTCDRPLYLDAFLRPRGPGRPAGWRLALRHLSRGRYRAVAVAADGLGRLELPLARDQLNFRVR